MTNAEVVPVPVAGPGAAGGGAKRGGGHLVAPGAGRRQVGGGSVLNYLIGGAVRVAAAPQGART